jgi:hypothetical protein
LFFEYLRTLNSGGKFPAKDLYKKLCEEENQGKIHLLMLARPATLESVLKLTDSPILRTMEERFKNEEPQPRLLELYRHFWHRNSALLWIQRAMLTREYSDYDALADKNDKDNVPL